MIKASELLPADMQDHWLILYRGETKVTFEFEYSE